MPEDALSTNRVVIRRPIYKEDKNGMKVKYYDGSKWQNMELENQYKEHKIAQELTKFFNKNAFNNHGKISSEAMLSAWLSAQGDAPLAENDLRDSWSYNTQRTVIRSTKIERLDSMIKTACQEGSDGGSDVTQVEQFAIMKALANWFTK